MSPDEVLAALDPDQRLVAEALRGPVCVLAGAGTGKTRAITHRIAYGALTGEVPAQHVLAVTFTTRAASELRARLRTLGVPSVSARTFHSAGLRQLQYFWPRLVGGPFPQVAESKLRLVATALGRARLESGGPQVRDVAAEIEWAKSTLTAPADYPAAAERAGRTPPLPAAQIAEVYRAYEQVKEDAGRLDFEDLLLLTAAGIEEHRDVADEVRARYRHFVVDEYQDVTPLQQRLLDAWLGPRNDICVVGDAAQTIYSFTGATAEYLLGFTRRFQSATVIRLLRDYRSTPQVVQAARQVLGDDPGRLPLQAQRPDGPAVEVRDYPDEAAEAAAIAARCTSLVRRGTPPGEIAVLYRINAQSRAYEEALAAAGVAYQVRGAERFFDRAEVRQAMHLIRAAARSADPGTGGLAEQVSVVLRAAGWSANPPPGPGAARERWESMQAIATLAAQAERDDPAEDLAGFAAELAHRAEAGHSPDLDGVTLATLHAAKGLEWDAVHCVGLVEGSVPISYATTPAQIAEERRLLYVGATRARRELWLTYSLARNVGGRRSRQPSRFLQPLRRRRPAETPAANHRPRKRGPAGPADRELYERLRAWRLGAARELGQPAFCVFNDETLTRIAERRPATAGELAGIPGVGARRLEKFGPAVLAVVGGECDR